MFYILQRVLVIWLFALPWSVLSVPTHPFGQGEWASGKPHGQGTATHKDGEKYVGTYKAGLYHGEGEFEETCAAVVSPGSQPSSPFVEIYMVISSPKSGAQLESPFLLISWSATVHHILNCHP